MRHRHTLRTLVPEEKVEGGRRHRIEDSRPMGDCPREDRLPRTELPPKGKHHGRFEAFPDAAAPAHEIVLGELQI